MLFWRLSAELDCIDAITALTLAIDALRRAPQGMPRITFIGGSPF